MAIAQLERASLHYLLEGRPGAPTVVLSNSLGADLTMWERQAAGLAPHFQVLRYDTRGHGRSSAAGDAWTLDELGSDVIDLLDFLQIGRFHICGVSMGGMTALWLAIHAPERVLSLMPCNTAARIGTESAWNARIEQVRTHGMASIADATMERWFTPSFRASDSERVEATRQVLLRTDANGYAACCAALRDADLTAAISSIAVPALVVSGAHDPVTPPPDGRFLQQKIASGRYCELNAAHLSNVEQPAAFLQTMRNFFGSN